MFKNINKTNFNKVKEAYLSSYFLFAFKFIKTDKIIASYLDFLSLLINSNDIEQILQSYCNFVETLGSNCLADYSKEIILKNNIKTETNLNSNLSSEIKILENMLSLNTKDFKSCLSFKFKKHKALFLNLPEFENSKFELNSYELKKETGFNNTSRAFVFTKELILKPVSTVQNITFKDLKGYSYQKKVLFDNTSAHLKGNKVNNILLYGDAGCGKSSSIKALLNEFKELRIVQVFKDTLIHLDKLYEILANSPHKFIIFLDDITFDESDTEFSTMKAILEGALTVCPNNTIIYATSNRRHMVKETFQSRIGDEIHLKDTLNEISSLSERFGINLLFQKPTNTEFEEIVSQIAQDCGIKDDDLIQKAKRYALVKGSNSPRVIRQFIDNVVSKIEV